jgi:hypothetical protein
MKSLQLQAPGSGFPGNSEFRAQTARPVRARLTKFRAWSAAFLLAAPLLVWAQPNPNPPGQISYQGFVTDANGIPLATNNPINFNIQFRIWNASTGGSNMWGELQVVTVDRGYFTVMLGNGSSLPGVPFTNNLSGLFSGSDASDRYLELTVQGLAPGDPPIIPRLRLLGSPYSYLAGRVLDSGLSANVALRSTPNVFTGNQTITGGTLYLDNSQYLYAKNSVGTYEGFMVPRWSDNVMYLVYGANGFNIRNDEGATTMFMSDAGNVGIGTLGPGFPLNFPNSLGDKISLWGNTGNHFGFGIQGSLLQIYADVPASDIAFGYGQSSNLTELVRIKGTGNMGIGTANPGAKLHVSDSGFPSARIDSSNPGGTWLTLGNSAGGRYWHLISSGSGDTGGAGKFLIASGAQPNGSDVVPMTIQTNGNVGIGTFSPNNKLQIGDPYTGSSGYAITASSPNFGANIQVNTTFGIGLTVDDLSNGGTATPMLQVRNNNGTFSPTFVVYASGDVYAKSYNPLSDRNAKEKFESVLPEEVLNKVTSLPIQEWNFKDDATRHIGPMAQDFYAAFGVGPDDRHIATVDADGVALAAIQGLNQKLEQRLEQKETEITELKGRLERLERLLSHSSDNMAR